jgi:hypothetical protein
VRGCGGGGWEGDGAARARTTHLDAALSIGSATNGTVMPNAFLHRASIHGAPCPTATHAIPALAKEDCAIARSRSSAASAGLMGRPVLGSVPTKTRRTGRPRKCSRWTGALGSNKWMGGAMLPSRTEAFVCLKGKKGGERDRRENWATEKLGSSEKNAPNIGQLEAVELKDLLGLAGNEGLLLEHVEALREIGVLDEGVDERDGLRHGERLFQNPLQAQVPARLLGRRPFVAGVGKRHAQRGPPPGPGRRVLQPPQHGHRVR